MTTMMTDDRDTRIDGDTAPEPGTPAAWVPSPEGTRPSQAGAPETGDTDPHAQALSTAKTKTAAIRYAVAALAGAPPAEVMAWLGRYGIQVSRSKVSPQVKAYRDAHRPTNEAAPGDPGIVEQPPSTSGNTQIATPPASRWDTSRADATLLPNPPTAGDTPPDVPPEHRGHPGYPLDSTAGDSTAAGEQPARAGSCWRFRPDVTVALACYMVAVVSLLVSLTTSWRFFDSVLHIPTTNGERLIVFGVAELALVVCGAGMALNVRRHGRPGSFRAIVWAMCAAMAYMAWAMSPIEEAIGRILLGPVLGTIMLHLGLGIELRAHHQRTGTIARIGRELRERCLSRLGLADDGRDAAQRTRDRKAYQAAALSRPRRWPWSRQARLERALLAAGVADDPVMRDRMLARLAVVRHASSLAALSQPSPWAQP